MIEMSMAVDKNLNIRQLETKLSDILFDLRHCFEEPAVEKDVTLGSDNEKRSDVRRPNVVDISDDPIRLDRQVPQAAYCVCLSVSADRMEAENEQAQTTHQEKPNVHSVELKMPGSRISHYSFTDLR